MSYSSNGSLDTISDVIEFLEACRDSHEPYSHGTGPIPVDQTPDVAGTYEFHADTIREYDEALSVLRDIDDAFPGVEAY